MLADGVDYLVCLVVGSGRWAELIMRAMVLGKPNSIEAGPLRLLDLPVPKPGPREVRVRVQACGICRTDLHVVEADLRPKHEQIVPGHQVVGTVDALGPEA